MKAFCILLILIILVPNLWSQEIRAHKCGFGDPELRLSKRASPQLRNLDFLDESILSPSGEFRIHFTRTGSHAVLGGESSGTPEFVTEAAIAADSAYSILVGELGFLPPLPDGNIDGSELDIYIKNWGGSYYGMTYFGNSAPSPAYLVIDNDYTEASYTTSGLQALRVTIAHEFFHMVQVRYAYPGELNWDNVYWYEISSVWFEEYCYPEVNDYLAYVETNFNASQFPALDSYNYMYGHGIYGQVLDKEYGTRENKHIMLDLWENLSNKNAMDNLEQILSSSPWNSSLTDALSKYALYNVFTGSRTIAGLYYDDAIELIEVHTQQYDIPLDYTASFDFALGELEISYRTFTIPGSNDFYTRGIDLDPDQRAFLTYHDPTAGSSLKGALEAFWVPCSNVSDQDYLLFPLINGNREDGAEFTLSFEANTLGLEDTIQTLWPNPSMLKNGPIHLNVILSSSGTLKFNVYNILGQPVYQEEFDRPKGIHILDLKLPADTPSGIYFLKLISDKQVMSRKFTVLK